MLFEAMVDVKRYSILLAGEESGFCVAKTRVYTVHGSDNLKGRGGDNRFSITNDFI